jgi:hypothetical protein
VEYHVELAKEGQFDPKYFTVVSYRDWRTKGVVIVALDEEEMQCKPDLLWIKAEDAGLALVNLQISNVGWEELKEDSLEITDELRSIQSLNFQFAKKYGRITRTKKDRYGG